MNGSRSWGWPVMIGLIFGLFTLNQAIRQGQLALPITYDDVGYFNDALRRLWAMGDFGIRRLVHDYIVNPPHSPYASAVAFIGFALFGMHDWAPAAINIGLIIMLLVAYSKEMSGAPNWVFALAGVSLLCSPLPTFLVVESRPDYVCGLLSAYALLTMASRPWLGSTLRHQIWISSLIGVAILIKPTISPMTAALYVFSLFIISVTEWIGRRTIANIGGVIHTALVSVIIVLCISLIYFAFGWRHIYEYIVATEFGSEKDLWTYKANGLGQAVYYIVGPAGKALLGPWLWIDVGVLILCWVLGYLTKYRFDWMRLGLTATIVFIMYVSITIPPHKSPSVGSIFASALFILFARGVIFIIARLQSAGKFWLTLPVLVILLVTALYFQNSHWHYRSGGAEEPETLAIRTAQTKLLTELVDALSSRPSGTGKVFVTGTAQYLNADTLEYELLKAGERSFSVYDNAASSDLSATIQTLNSAQFVVAFSADNDEPLLWLPSAGTIAALARYLAKSAEFAPVAAFESATGTGSVILYERR